MKKVSASVLSLAVVAGLALTTTSFAVITTHVNETHRQGEINIKVKNLSHSMIKVDCAPCGATTFGGPGVGFTTVKDSFSDVHKLGFKGKADYVVRYDIDKSTPIEKRFGSKITMKKLYKVVDGCHYYKRCTVAVFGGPGKPSYKMWGSLCHNVDVKATLHSGTTSYVRVNYDPMHAKAFH